MLEWLTGFIGGLLYPLFSIIFKVINLMQTVFYGLAGVGDIEFENARMPNGELLNGSIGDANDGGETSTGLIYYLLSSDLAKNLFMSIMLLALFLIIIFTAMAFIKNAYSSKQKNWQEIVGNAFKGLANFIFIPVCCLLGVWLSNILLLAINGATSTGGSTQMSRKLFICCAYEANEYRRKTEVDATDIADIKLLVETCNDVDVDFDENHTKTDVEYFANVVDTVYAQTSKDYANITWWDSVERHYSLFNFNYLTLIVGGVFMLYVLVSVAYAMIKRMFILLMLFVISPAICAMYPIDEGSAVGNWKKEFIKYTISAYGTVVAMNLFFSILPIVENINLVAGAGAFLNDIFQLLIMVSGLFVVKEFMGTLSGWIGGDNAMATGENLRKQTKGAMDKYAKPAVNKTIGAFGNWAGHIAGRRSEGQGWGRSIFGGMKSSLGDTLLGARGEDGKRKGGLLRFIGGDTAKNVEETFKSVKTDFDSGKASGETRGKALNAIKQIYADNEEYKKKNAFTEMKKSEYEKANDAYKAEKDPVKSAALKADMLKKRGEYGAAKRAENKISKELKQEITDLAPGMRNKFAKKYGVEVADLDIPAEAESKNITYMEKLQESQTIVQSLENVMGKKATQTDYDKLSKSLGLDIQALGKTLNISIEKLAKLLEGGAKLDEDKYTTVARKVAATQFNKAVDKYETVNDSAKNSGKEFMDYVLSNYSKLTDKDGNKLKFDQATIDALKDAFKANDVQKIEDNRIVKALKEFSTRLEKGMMDQVKTLQDVEKAMRDKK